MKLLGKIYLFGLLGCFFISVYFFWLLIEPFKTPTVTPYPIPILNKNKTVHYGEPIITKVRSCTFQAVPVTASVKYEDQAGRVYFFSSHDSVGKVGCQDSIQNRDPIPATLPPGKYTIYITAVFRVNQLQTITKVYQTESFQLVR